MLVKNDCANIQQFRMEYRQMKLFVGQTKTEKNSHTGSNRASFSEYLRYVQIMTT